MIIIDEKDPPWITNTIKRKISQKNQLYKKFIRNGKKVADYQYVLNSSNELEKLINTSKSTYFT